MPKNQRLYRRVKPKSLSTRVRVAGTLHIGLPVENLSLGGAFIRCSLNPPLKLHASLEISAPSSSTPLLLSGKVTYLVSLVDAQQRRVSPGFAMEFQKPLPPHVQRGLEALLKTIDARALEPEMPARPEPIGDPDSTVTVEALKPEQPSGENHELLALRKLVAAHEREIERLRKENAQLRVMLKRASS